MASLTPTQSCLRPAPSSSLRQKRPGLNAARKLACIGAASKGKGGGLHRSFDDAEDLDSELASELSLLADPKRAERMQKHLELVWKINKLRRPQTCTCCSGTGEIECNWCHGTGFMTVGDQLIVQPHSRSTCPVCKSKGYIKCEACRGTGSRAQWLEPPVCPTTGGAQK